MARDFRNTEGDLIGMTDRVILSLPYTVAVWFNTGNTGLSGLLRVLWDVAQSNLNYHALWVNPADSKLTFAWAVAGVPTSISTGNLVDTSTAWNLGVVSARAGAVKLSLNGDTGESMATTSATPGSPLGYVQTDIGSFRSVSNFWNGLIAWVTVWNADLHEREFSQLWQGVHPFSIRPQNIASCVPLWGKDSPEFDLAPAAQRQYATSKTWVVFSYLGDGPDEDPRQPPMRASLFPPRVYTDVELFTGAGGGDLGAIEGVGAGEEVFAGLANGVLSPIDGAGIAEEVLSGAGTGPLSPMEGSGTGQEVFEGVSIAALAPIEGSGTGIEVFEGTANADLGPIEGSGSANEVFEASGSGLYGPIEASGAGSLAFSATANGVLSPITGVGVAEEVFSTSGNGVLSPIVGDGIGEFIGGPVIPPVFVECLAFTARVDDLVAVAAGGGGLALRSSLGSDLSLHAAVDDLGVELAAGADLHLTAEVC